MSEEASPTEIRMRDSDAAATWNFDVEQLVRDHGERLWRALYACSGGRRDLADDAVSESFARLLKHRERVRQPLAWVYRTAFRIVWAEQRRERRPMPALTELAEQRPGDLLGVLDALRMLSPAQRVAVVLRYEEDISVRDISELTGSSVAAVKVHLFRGRRRLRELLGSEEAYDA